MQGQRTHNQAGIMAHIRQPVRRRAGSWTSTLTILNRHRSHPAGHHHGATEDALGLPEDRQNLLLNGVHRTAGLLSSAEKTQVRKLQRGGGGICGKKLNIFQSYSTKRNVI